MDDVGTVGGGWAGQGSGRVGAVAVEGRAAAGQGRAAPKICMLSLGFASSPMWQHKQAHLPEPAVAQKM